MHAGVQRWVGDLNRVYRERAGAACSIDFDTAGFEWIDADDVEQSVLAFLRERTRRRPMLLVVCNFTPVPRANYRVGVPRGGRWRELLNSDAPIYGGSGMGNLGRRRSGAGPGARPVPFAVADAAAARA